MYDGAALMLAPSWFLLLARLLAAARQWTRAFVVEPPRLGRVQLGGVERSLALPTAQDVAKRLADDRVGHLGRPLGQLERPEHAIAAGGQEVAGRDLVAAPGLERLARDADAH